MTEDLSGLIWICLLHLIRRLSSTKKLLGALLFTSNVFQHMQYMHLYNANILDCNRRYPLMASASDDGTVHIFHSTVYR